MADHAELKKKNSKNTAKLFVKINLKTTSSMSNVQENTKYEIKNAT